MKKLIVVLILVIIGICFNIKNEVINVENNIENDVKNDVLIDVEEELINESTTEIPYLTQEEVDSVENEEVEGFELQGDIAYEGAVAKSWGIELGNCIELTYYSQIDSRWKNKPYTSTGNPSQTIGSSACGPTSAAMIVSSIKGTVTPDIMADTFVKFGYRSSNNGTYWSAYRAVADEFDIEYSEFTSLDTAIEKLKTNHYLIASCGNGLFTTGGHYIVIYGIDDNTLKIYDPYLYAGKFDTSTRRGKVTVIGNTVYCSVDNFRNYANYKGFFCYTYENQTVNTTDDDVKTQLYTRYVCTENMNLNVRDCANGNKIGSLTKGTQVTVIATSGNWSQISNPINGWVCNDYLGTSSPSYQKEYTTKLTSKTKIYANSSLTGTYYTYLANTTIKVLSENSGIKYVEVIQTGRRGYIGSSQSASQSSTYKILKQKCYIFSNSNLIGTKYTYLSNTKVKVIRSISNSVDYIQVVKTGRFGYINKNNYK